MMSEQSMEQFLQRVASKNPVPGGGSVAAQSGATAAALVEMVASLTISKRGYEEVQNEMVDIQSQVKKIRSQMVKYIEEDAKAFESVMNAYGMPRDTDELKRARSRAIQKGLKLAAEVPLKVAKLANQLMDYGVIVVEKGNKNAVTDGGVSLMLARTALRAAIYNVKINLSSIKDVEFVDKLRQEIEKIEKESEAKELKGTEIVESSF